jgi:HAD superfamily hydrolase (TIGR01509 family)
LEVFLTERSSLPVDALIFDFDGLILETETPIYQSWLETYQSHGCQLSFDDWASIIGSADVEFNPMEDLARQCGDALDRKAIEEHRRQREFQLVLAQPVMPGVADYLETAVRLRLKIGLASSSPCEWVEGHLERLGLLSFFEHIIASDDVALTKPDPALYLNVCQALKVAPGRAVALEDSPNGALAAKRAGMYCVAVPNELTKALPFPPVDLRLESLAAMPLEALLEKLNHTQNK